MVAAGNDRTAFDNANTSNFTSSRFVNAIAAVADNGQISYYSNPGASLLVASPSNGGTLGITTTDYTGALGYGAGDYTSTFGGTSAATPIASGVVGLMLEANPGLGYRDVMEILAITARKIGNPAAAGEGGSLRPWQENGATNWNNGGMHFSHDYGFGLIDAFAAVKLADSWNLRQDFANELSVSASNNTTGAVPDNNATGISRTVALTPASGTPLTVEAIEVQINWSVAHTYSSDLVIELISPTGMVSYLLDRAGGAADLTSWVFMTRAHLGELATGDWTIRISDRFAGDTGTISNITVRAYGSSDVNDNYYYTDEFGSASAALSSRQTLTDTDGGNDTINVSALSAGATINLNASQPNTIGGSSFVIAAGTVIENVIGSWSNDLITGNDVANTLRGNAGNDTIFGAGGDDGLYGGAGSDTIDGGDGADFYFFEAAWDAVQWVVTDLIVTFDFFDQLLGIDTVSNVEFFTDGLGVQKLWTELAGQPPVIRPAAPVITSFGDNSGAPNDSVTNDRTPTLAITTEADIESVEVFLDGVSQGNATGGSGKFTFTPATGLDDGAYSFTAKATKLGLQSAASTGLAVTIDATAPQLTNVSPADNAASVSPASNIVLTFTENVIAGAGNISLWLASNATLWQSIAIGAPEVSIVGNRVTINPTNDLPASTAIYITVDAGALTDVAGNGFAGVAGSTTFNFTTAAGNVIDGTAAADTINGTNGNDIINGLAGADTISGNAGDDVIDGGAANDILNGGTNTGVGDTVTYASATAAVTVSLAVTASQNTGGAGRDTLSNFENLIGTAFNDRLTGSSTANRIDGGAGNDTITGGAGSDTLDGGAGSDVYIITALSEKSTVEVVDTGLTGTDELRFTAAANSTLTILAGDTGLERVAIGTGTGASAVTTATTALNVDASAGANGLNIVGNAGINRLTGTAFADRVEGGSGNDILGGGAGSDTLIGGAGNDALTGGADADVFVFNFAPDAASNRDTITDFVSAQDDIWLARAVMTGLGPTLGALSVDAFRFGAGVTTAGDATDRIIYNTTNGALYYDADGTGAAAAIQLANLSGAPTLTFSDFLIF